MLYEKIVRPILFRYTDPEKIHHFTISALGVASRIKPINQILTSIYTVNSPVLKTKLGSLTLANPVGLAAGFDKYIDAPLSYPMLGFGFAELGSITYGEQPGNPTPRLWRLPDDKGLIVYYGLSNAGALKTSDKLEHLVNRPAPLGVSIAPTTGVPLNGMAGDYAKSFLVLHKYADYVTFNVSCPNVASCDMFSQISFIQELLVKIKELKDQNKIIKDCYIKIGPHHSEEQLLEISRNVIAAGFVGIIASNLVKDRTSVKPQSSSDRLNHPGGISGRLTQTQSNHTIKTLYLNSNGKIKIIGVGGIFNAADAYQKIRLGASALQLITGFVYGGPGAIKKINAGLVQLATADGFKNIAEAVGVDA